MASPARPSEGRRSAPRLYLVTPEAADPDRLAVALADALPAGDIAAVLLRLPAGDERALIKLVKRLAPRVQERGAALVLDGHPEIVARAGADGAHLAGLAALKAALALLRPARIAGCGRLATRHDAMLAGEAGADYVMFGEPDQSGRRPPFDAIAERIAWWAELFEVPCVGFAGGVDEIEALAAAGADFIALGDWALDDIRGCAAILSEATRHLAAAETPA